MKDRLYKLCSIQDSVTHCNENVLIEAMREHQAKRDKLIGAIVAEFEQLRKLNNGLAASLELATAELDIAHQTLNRSGSLIQIRDELQAVNRRLDALLPDNTKSLQALHDTAGHKRKCDHCKQDLSNWHYIVSTRTLGGLYFFCSDHCTDEHRGLERSGLLNT